jgi:hypothetical protein
MSGEEKIEVTDLGGRVLYLTPKELVDGWKMAQGRYLKYRDKYREDGGFLSRMEDLRQLEIRHREEEGAIRKQLMGDMDGVRYRRVVFE